jgi:transposase InsO family protein
LTNHIQDLVSADFFVVPTATFRLLFVFVVLCHDRRRMVHFAVTRHPTAEWTAQQLLQAFPWDTAPPVRLCDRDRIYGEGFRQTAAGLGIDEVLCAPHSPWQNAYAERVIGSIRRECLDHVIVVHQSGLRRVLHSYFAYYAGSRTPLSLDKDTPLPRAIQPPPALGSVVELPEVGGLHQRYERRAA